jgi:ABC-2 type transport system ATP-binding protein
MKIAVELDAIAKTYRPRRHTSLTALTGISFQVPEGQIVGLLGAPGAGKTTLLKLIGGLLTPTAGHVQLFGFDVVRQRQVALCQVGIVLAGAGNVDVRGPAQTAPFHYYPPAAWTRLAIASALAPDPRILLLDEPTLGLDEHDAKLMLTWIERFARVDGRTIILASRHVENLREHCDRVVLLHGGRLALDRPANVLRGLGHEDAYQITVKGHLDGDWSEWFEGLQIKQTDDGETILTGPIADQTALHGLLIKVRDLGLPLLSLTRVELGLSEVLSLLPRPADPADLPKWANGATNKRKAR